MLCIKMLRSINTFLLINKVGMSSRILKHRILLYIKKRRYTKVGI